MMAGAEHRQKGRNGAKGRGMVGEGRLVEVQLLQHVSPVSL